MGDHFIGGRFVEGHGPTFFSINPATEGKNWEGKEASFKDVCAACLAAKNAFTNWKSIPFEQRISYILNFQKILEIEKESLAEAISKEMGKPLWESKLEVQLMIDKIPLSIQAYKERCGRKEIKRAATIVTAFRPHGPVVVLGPFNFPGHLPNGHIIPSLIAGNTVIFKGSESTPLVNEKMALLWEKAQLPPGVFNSLQGGKETGMLLATQEEIRGIYFTGSYKTGKSIMEALGPIPQKIVALEMGGNNPLVISTVSDLEAAAYATIQSAFLTSGQRCTSARRLILVESAKNETFLQILSQMTELIQVGTYNADPQPFMGPLISQKIADLALERQDYYKSRGGRPLVEIKKLKDSMPFVTPGIIDVTQVSSRKDEEIFAPFLQVIRVKNFEEALQEANNTKYGLCASLFSDSREEFDQFFERIEAGVINWNLPTIGASGAAPFGGIKKSGNYHPSGYFAADYCSYPLASSQSEMIHLPKSLTPGVALLAKT